VSTPAGSEGTGLHLTLTDGFWAPRQAQLRDHTIEVLLDRLR
jgi:hypothetical protein